MKRALLFSGQGAQQIGMNRDLLTSPRLAEIYRQADAIVGYPLSQISAEGPEEKLTSTAVCQPALYVHGYALLAATRERIPTFHLEAAAGLSLGEYTAHVAAGTFDFTTGLELVHERATLMQQACDPTRCRRPHRSRNCPSSGTRRRQL
jgi:[acyl-carrier-protein] S-malonyltransferase